MDMDLAKKLQKQNPDYKIHENYSGRNMYGNETVALEVDSRDEAGYIKTKCKKEFKSVVRLDQLGLNWLVY